MVTMGHEENVKKGQVNDVGWWLGFGHLLIVSSFSQLNFQIAVQ
jgi:hypothetical protein